MNNLVNWQYLSTGIPGLDDVLGGGLRAHRVYLVEGEPGTGKTATGLQFLMEGARRGERVLYITLAESAAELRSIADSHGWDLSGIAIHEVITPDDALLGGDQFTIFHPSEIEMSDMLKRIVAAVEEQQPTRVVLDSLSELQLLAESPLRYRRQVLALKNYFAQLQCTVILLDDRSAAAGDLQVRSIAHGVIQLEFNVKDYGTERRRLRIVKYRGQAFSGGLHDYTLGRGGLVVHPRLVASESRSISTRKQLSSSLPQLDLLLGGGLEEGTSTLLLGPPGTGKSSLAAQFVSAACDAGLPAAMFLFEESTSNMLHRADALNMDLRGYLAASTLTIQQVDPAELTPGQFSSHMRAAVLAGVKVVVIDSLNGYLQAVPDERFLMTHLHEVLTYLGQHKVVTIMIGVQQGMLGGSLSSTLDASYIADNVVMLRYFELDGEIRQAVSVFKKRGSAHERTIRAFSMSAKGIHVGETLRGYRGILSGVPTPTFPASVDSHHHG